MDKSNQIVVENMRSMDPGQRRIFHIDFVKIHVWRNSDYPAIYEMRFEYDGHEVHYPFVSDVNDEFDRMIQQGILEIFKQMVQE